MTAEEIHQRLASALGERVGSLQPAKKDAFAVVAANDLISVCTFLKTDPDLAMDCLLNVSAVDWPKKNQLEVVYHLFSYAKHHGFVLKVQLDRANPEVSTLTGLWKSADWLEREQYDLLGVKFTGHPDLRRVLLPDDWPGHPLRKDWVEPAAWHGISTTRESPLDGFVRLDELRKKAAAPAAPPAAPAPEHKA